MIGLSFLIAAAFLLLLLFFLRRGEESAEEVGSRPGSQSRHGRLETVCPPEVTHSIFSQQDFEFISGLDSPRLLRIYRQERKGVALHWIRRASSEIRLIAHEHVRTARLSQNLNPAAETKLFFQYIVLLLIWGWLMIFIRFMNPPVLHGVAAYLSKVSHQIGRAQRDFEIATQIATPQDSGTP